MRHIFNLTKYFCYSSVQQLVNKKKYDGATKRSTFRPAAQLPPRMNWKHPLIARLRTHAVPVPFLIALLTHGFVLLSCFLYLYWAELLNWIKRGFSFCTRILIMFMKRRKFTWLGRNRKMWAENKRVWAKLIHSSPRALSHPYGNYNGTLDDPPIKRVFIYVPAPGTNRKVIQICTFSALTSH